MRRQKPSFGGEQQVKGLAIVTTLHIPQRMASHQNLLEQAHLKAQVHPAERGGSDRVRAFFTAQYEHSRTGFGVGEKLDCQSA